jgi:hypothetical protein
MIESFANLVSPMSFSQKDSFKTFTGVCIFTTDEPADNACLATRTVQLLAQLPSYQEV